MFVEILEMSWEWAKARYPNSSPHHRGAFTNSVAYLVTGTSGGYGGPSLREHLVSWSLGEVGVAALPNGGPVTTVRQHPHLPRPGEWSFGAACEYAAPLCFDPPEQYGALLLQIWEREHCYDDDPDDLAYVRGGGR